MKDITLLEKPEDNKTNLEKIVSSEDQIKIDLGPSYKEVEKDINLIVNTPINNWNEKNIAEKINGVIEIYELISIYNNINFNAFLDKVILPIVYQQDNNLCRPKIGRKFRTNYEIQNNNKKEISAFKKEEITLDEKLIELKKEMTDYKFTLREILEIENLKEFIGKGIDEIEKQGIYVNIEQSFEEDKINYTKEFNRKENKKKRISSGTGYPVIVDIYRRVKQTKRLGKKAFDIVNKLRDVPQKLYEDLYKKVVGKEYNQLKTLDEKQFQKIVMKIHEYLTYLDENKGSKKIHTNNLNEAINYYNDIMLGRPNEPNKSLYKNKKINPKYKKDRIESRRKQISDRFAGTVNVEKNEDIDKIINQICIGYFKQNPGDCYSNSKKFKNRALDRNFDGVVQIKNYRGDNIKKNKFEGVQMRIRYSGTDMELLLMTKENHKKSRNGDASHTKYKFFQRLMREVSLYNNKNQKLKYDSILGFFAKTR